MENKLTNYKKGDVLSETSHYKVENIIGNSVHLKHWESGNIITISKDYLDNYVRTCDYYNEEVKVSKEDKKDGTLGIRSIWENIHSQQVFTVCFKKQDKPKTNKKIKEEIETVISTFCEEIETVKANKKGVADCAKRLIEQLAVKPILPYIEGEDRILRGYKIQFVSRDGKYDCVDMDIDSLENNIRPVNINTIKWLIFNNVKYIVE